MELVTQRVANAALQVVADVPLFFDERMERNLGLTESELSKINALYTGLQSVFNNNIEHYQRRDELSDEEVSEGEEAVEEQSRSL